MEDRLNKTDDTFKLVKDQFEEYLDATLNSRREAEKCRDYRDGKQWTDEEVQTLKKRKQPCITDNKIQDKCDTLLGMEKQMRTDPMAYPRNPEDEQSAEAATDALRYIADKSDFNRSVRKEAADNLMIEGLCAGQVVIEKKRGKPPEVCMEHIRWDRVFYDVYSMNSDFSDKTFVGYFTWVDEDQAKRDFPDAKEMVSTAFSGESTGGQDQTTDDKPRYISTVRGRKRLQVFTTYFIKEGKWHYGTWCKGGWLEGPKVSTYKDEDGNPACPIELQALYRDRDGYPYGSVQRYIDLQDEHNKRRSKMLHLLNSKRIIAQTGTIEDVNKVRAEMHKPDGVVMVNGDIAQFSIQDNLNEAEGQWKLLQQTDLALSQTGPNAALAGLSGDISGRAKQLDQQSGTLPISPLFDALESWQTRMYRQAWLRVRQFWNAEMWIRVTDDEQKTKFVVLNQDVLQGDMIAEQLKAQPIPPEEKQALLQEIAADPASQMPVLENGKPKKKNNVAKMDVDIIIDRSPDVITLQQEQFGILSEIAKSRPEIPFDVLIEASSLRSETKKKILDRIKGTNDPAAAQQAQFMQKMQELEAMLKEAQAFKTQTEGERNQAQTAQIQAQTVQTGIQTATSLAEASSAPEEASQPL